MAPSFNSKFWSMIPPWKSPSGRTGWKDEIIPYGPFLNDDVDGTGYTYYVPYTIKTIFPASGPLMGGTEVLI